MTKQALRLCFISAFVVLSITGSFAQDTEPGDGGATYVIPTKSPQECGATLQNSTSDLIVAFSSCLASSSASPTCCESIEKTFTHTNEKFGGCLCHPILMNTVMELADGFLPGASSLIPDVMHNCTTDAQYASNFAYFGQTNGVSMCDPSVLVDVDATDSSILEAYMPPVNAQSVDSESASPADDASEEENKRKMDSALTVFTVLTAEECGANLLTGKDQLIGALTPCILAEAPTQMCCRAVEEVFRPTNEDFGGCLCHKEVVDGIFAEAEGFLPGSTALIENAFDTCTNEFGSHFSFHGQQVGHESCTGEALRKPSLAQVGGEDSDKEEEHPLSFIEENFGAPSGSNSAASTGLTAFVSLLVAAVSLSYGLF